MSQPTVIYDLSPCASLYKTGIPNYTLSLAKELLNQDRARLLGNFNHIVLESAPTQKFINESLACFEDISRNSPSLFQKRKLKILNLAKNQIKRISPIYKLLKVQQVKKSTHVLSKEKAQVQHVTSHHISHSFDQPLCFTVYDMSPIVHPEFHETHNVDIFKNSLNSLKNLATKKAVEVLCISQSTKDAFCNHMGASWQDHAHVTLLGCDTEIFNADKNFTKTSTPPFILSVGTLEPRKNLTSLLDAFSLLAAENSEIELFVVGAQGWKNNLFFTRLENHPFKNRIRVLGHVPDAELAKLYKSCEVFCYPSLYEGFGLPVLEALSCGASVACSNSSSLPEITRNAAALFDPTNSIDIAKKISLAINQKSDFSQKGQQRSKNFSWADTAEKTLGVYQKLIKRS